MSRLTKTGKRVGRPPAKIDERVVEGLARIHCTVEEIAAVCGVCEDTIRKRFSGLIEKGKREGKASLRRLQYKGAEAGNATMLIWLGKQLLGQKDTHDVRLSVEEIDAAIAAELARVAARRETGAP